MSELYQSIATKRKDDGILVTATSSDLERTDSQTVDEVRLCPMGTSEHFVVESDRMFFESEGATDSITLNTFNGVARISFE